MSASSGRRAYFASARFFAASSWFAALLLAALAIGGIDRLGRALAQLVFHRRLSGQCLGHRPGFLGAGLGQFDDRLDHRLEALCDQRSPRPSIVSSESSCASDSTISTPCWVPATTRSSSDRSGIGRGRVQDVLPIDIADARAGDRPHERDARDGQRRRGADQSDDIGVVFKIVAQHRADDLRLVEEARRRRAAGSAGRSAARSVSPFPTGGLRA